MIHGLFVGSYVFRYLSGRFRQRGWTVALYDYPTVRRELPEHASRLARELESARFDAAGQLHFVTHSMGALVLRGALGELSADRLARLGRAVMIAPPNRGSDSAALAEKCLPGIRQLIAPIHDLSSTADSFANTVPLPETQLEIGVIAAAADRRVRVEYTHLDRMSDHRVLPGAHTWILFRRATFEQSWNFLRSGKFAD
ncbi:MAG: alpha/beta fold hydrolase [Lentisphaeria bacterium]|nr:alpha/beta fold hydrolase [Lentisphaeria bacterium]